MRLEVEVFGDVQVARDLLRFGDRAQDAEPAFRSIADMLQDSERRQFASGGRHASGGWEKLADATRRSKRRSPDPRVRANAEKILVATGALRDSLTRSAAGLDGDAIRVVEPHQLVYGTQVPYARFHQLGKGVPRRRVIEVRAQDRREMVKRIQRHLMTGRPT